MLLRRFTDFILRGRLQAMGTAFALAFIPVVGSISILIAALVTLRKSAYEGALVFVVASIPLLIQYAVIPSESQTDTLVYMMAIMMISNLLTWFLAVLLRQYSSWNLVLEITILIGMIIVGLVHILYPDIQAWWVKQFTAYFNKTLNVVDTLKSGASPQEFEAELIASAKYYATGFAVVSVLFNVLLQLFVARWWQGVIFNPGALSKELKQIRLSHVAAILFVIILFLSYFKNNIALDTVPLLYSLFCIAGLSLIHYMLSFTKTAWLWLLVVYGGIVWLFPFSIMIIAVGAFFDSWLDFRKRIHIRLN